MIFTLDLIHVPNSTMPRTPRSKTDLSRLPESRYPTPLLKILALRHKGVSLRDVSALIGVPETTIRSQLRQLAGILETPSDIQAYESSRAQLLSAVESRYLSSIASADLEKVSVKDRAVIMAILFDKGRLERGKATAHVAVLASLVGESDKSLFSPRSKSKSGVNDTPQPEVCDTPTTPIPRGTGGLEDERVSVVSHDLQVLEKTDELVDIVEESIE